MDNLVQIVNGMIIFEEEKIEKDINIFNTQNIDLYNYIINLSNTINVDNLNSINNSIHYNLLLDYTYGTFNTNLFAILIRNYPTEFELSYHYNSFLCCVIRNNDKSTWKLILNTLFYRIDFNKLYIEEQKTEEEVVLKAKHVLDYCYKHKHTFIFKSILETYYSTKLIPYPFVLMKHIIKKHDLETFDFIIRNNIELLFTIMHMPKNKITLLHLALRYDSDIVDYIINKYKKLINESEYISLMQDDTQETINARQIIIKDRKTYGMNISIHPVNYVTDSYYYSPTYRFRHLMFYSHRYYKNILTEALVYKHKKAVEYLLTKYLDKILYVKLIESLIVPVDTQTDEIKIIEIFDLCLEICKHKPLDNRGYNIQQVIGKILLEVEGKSQSKINILQILLEKLNYK